MIVSGTVFFYTLYILFILHSKYQYLLITDWNLIDISIKAVLSLIIYLFAFKENANKHFYWILTLVAANLNPVLYFDDKNILTASLVLIGCISIFCFYGFYKASKRV